MAKYVYPIIGDLPIPAIETKDVLAVLKPHWREKSETMSRVRGRIERLLAAASVEGLRTGNPAVWKGHLKEARLGKKRKSIPYRALGYLELPAFLVELRALKGVTPRALEFLILTTARTTETIEARWSEIDEVARVWNVPAERMKAGRPHEVPLSARALEILAGMKPLRDLSAGFIFPGRELGRPLSNMAMLELLKRMGYAATVHGFRSAFKTWAEEESDHAKSVIEASHAHVIADKTERSYMRGTWSKKRRALIEQWADYCMSAPVDTVVELRGKIPA